MNLELKDRVAIVAASASGLGKEAAFTLTERLKELGEATAKREKISLEEIYQRWQSTIPMKRLGKPR